MFLKNSTYHAAEFLIKKLEDNLDTPIITPKIVQKIILINDTKSVFNITSKNRAQIWY